jgi:hypothetical protein
LGASWSNFVLKNYDLAIEQARKSIALKPDYNGTAHLILVSALVLTGHEAEAREALQRYLALPSAASLNTIEALKGTDPPHPGPRQLDGDERQFDALRKLGFPEK